MGCTVIGSSVGVIAGGAVFDQLLEEAGQGKIFLPFMAKGVQFFIGG